MAAPGFTVRQDSIAGSDSRLGTVNFEGAHWLDSYLSGLRAWVRYKIQSSNGFFS